MSLPAMIHRLRGRHNALSLLVIAVIAAAALAVVACGSDDADVGPGEEGGSVQAFRGDSAEPAPAEDADVVRPPVLEAESVAAPPSATGDGGGSGPVLPDVQTLGRTIIRSGSIELVVEEVDTSYHRVQQIAGAAGGFVADSTFSGAEDRQRATVTIRVPAARFTEVVDQLRDLAVEVRTISTSAQDVTEEYADLESSLRNLRAVEAQYLELLGRAGEISDILQVQERLNGVRHEIERIEGRLRLLDDLSDLATLTVSLYPVPEEPEPVVESTNSGLGAAVRDAWNASLVTLETIATVVLTAVVFSWWLLPLLVVAGAIGRRLVRQRPRPALAGVDTPEGGA